MATFPYVNALCSENMLIKIGRRAKNAYVINESSPTGKAKKKMK